MAFLEMRSELAEATPGMSRIYAGTLINRAWRVVRDSSLWSFQLGQGGFSTPNITTGGTITATLGSNQIIGDATATALWAALPFMFSPTVQQIRAQGYSIYSIIAYDNGSDPVNSPNYPFATLTLDRPFIDPLPFYTGVGYQMFMAYIAAPPYFKRWLNIADLFNCYPLDIWTGRRTINLNDSARLYTSNPYQILGLGTDQRGAGTINASATLGQQLYELYPNPSTAISYATYYVVSGADLINNSDELPYPITQELVLSKARVYTYEWAEARKDVIAAKGSGANYSLLKKEGEAEFLARLKTLRLLDREAVDSYEINMNAFFAARAPFYNHAVGRANMGLGWR
jgi:hypothetical protein